ncbi:fungal-specific transcription factor domain-containing protein [Terfezia claveryi]|nr:fungal-specific transcription factor domain-containing protein [Terfezia claveryi]
MAASISARDCSPYPSPGPSFNSPYAVPSSGSSLIAFTPSPSLASSTCATPVSINITMPETPVVPKIEEIEDEHVDIKPVPFESALPTQPPIKRGRGRPRKNPIPAPEAKSKGGRTKTGCLTCRWRKKKCDEAKPRCQYIPTFTCIFCPTTSRLIVVIGNNCIRNSFICEGYPERVFWRPGRQDHSSLTRQPGYLGGDFPVSHLGELLFRARAPVQPRASPGSCTIPTINVDVNCDLPFLIDGVETPQDRLLLDHFVYDVSRVLTLINDETNPFQELILPIAVQHRGLMHSLLCLSGAHLARKDREPKFKIAQAYHLDQALRILRAETNGRRVANGPIIAQMLILCLVSICLGEREGQYRPHLNAARGILYQLQTDTPFGRFLFEFFMYHDVANSITCLDRRPIQYMEDFCLPGFILQPGAGALLGVLDGLFGYISKITILRDAVREHKRKRICVNYEMLSTAVAIDSEIRMWVPPQHPDRDRYIAALLYRQSTWVYLYRTIQPSQPGPKIRRAVEEGLTFMQMLPENSATQSILLMPLFMLGCAAFEPSQRPLITDRFKSLYEYSGLGNVVAAHEAVGKVWHLMDAGDENAWDWETILHNMGYDFLVA